jgi:cytochrome o ubiquinol oxidase subunit 2
MNYKNKILFLVLVSVDTVLVLFSLWLILGHSLRLPEFAVLSAQGVIARQEWGVLLNAILLMLIAVIPTFFLLFFFAWKYREGKTAKYSPEMQSSFGAGFLLWATPAVIIFFIGVLNWKSTHALDPYKPIASDRKPIIIQVVALQWKWLFIYPEQNIATVNFIEFPENTPVSFELTADAPMNSFWIPQLGGQMYAMPGMSTQLHLLANHTGEFNGSTAEISGAGFAGMRFVAKAASQADFDQWIKTLKQSPNILTLNSYGELAKPGMSNSPVYYSSVEQNLYNGVIAKFMAPAPPSGGPMTQMEGMK